MGRKTIALAGIATFGAMLVACAESDSGSTESDSGSTDSASPYYEGKTITVVVPNSPGGGTDIFARFLAEQLHRDVPGEPTVQVVNEPGAGTLIAANKFATSEEDGLTIFIASGGTTFNYVLGHAKAEYSYADWIPLAGLPTGNVIYAASDIGVASAADLLNSDEPLTKAETSVSSSSLPRLLSFEVLDLDVKIVTGYDGNGPARVAFQQGETNLGSDTTPAYIANAQPLVDEGSAVPVYTLGAVDGQGNVVRDPVVSDIPDVTEAHESMYGEAPSGPAWDAYKEFLDFYSAANKIAMVRGGTPDAALAALREGIEIMIENPEFEARKSEVLGGYELLIGKPLQRAVDAMNSADPDNVAWVKSWLMSTYDVDITAS